MENVFSLAVGAYGDTIEWLLFDSKKMTLQLVGSVSGIENPSFLTFNPKENRLYSVSEKEGGEVVCIDIDFDTKTLTERNRQLTNGDSPCFISLSPNGQWLFTANYGSGSFIVHPLGEGGTLEHWKDSKGYAGKSIVANRQESSHLHAIRNIPGTDKYIAADLGADCIYIYRFDESTGRLNQIKTVHTVPGSGPRHFTFHPKLPIFYVAEELQPNVSVYTYDNVFENIKRIQRTRTIPEDFEQNNLGADIHISRAYSCLYVSNRGHNSITTYKIEKDGLLRKLDTVSTEGEWPRNFVITANGRYILVANEHANMVVVMRIMDNGVPAATGVSYRINRPVCIRLREYSQSISRYYYPLHYHFENGFEIAI